MDRGLQIALVAAFLLLGIGIGGVIGYMGAGKATVTVTETLERTITVSAPGTTVTSYRVLTPTATETVTVTKTFTETARTTITSTAWATETVTETRTVTLTVTETATVTRTVTAAPVNASTTPAHAGQGYLAALTQPPPLPGKPVAGAAGLRLYLGNGLLVVEKDVALHCFADAEQALRGSSGSITYLAPGRVEDGVTAVYARIEPGRVVAAYSLRELSSRLPPGSYTLYDFSTGVECGITITGGYVAVDGCRVSGAPSICSPGLDSFDSVLAALAGLDDDTVEATASLVLSSLARERGVEPAVLLQRLRGDPAEAAWSILGYMDEHFTYNYSKASEPHAEVYSPLRFLALGSGICSDYAVFGAAMLLNTTGEAYVVTMDTPGGGHAVAAAGINGRLYVLDQHLPVVELQDYLEYVAPGASDLLLYRVTPGPVVEVFRLNTSLVDDGYPLDRMDDPLVVEEARHIVAEDLGLRPYQGLEAFIDPLGWNSWYWLRLPRLGGAVNATAREAPLDVAYTPVFRDQWARLVAGYAEKLHEKYYQGVASGSAMWLDVGHGSRDFYIYYVAVDAPPVNASLRVDSGRATYSFDLPSGVDPVRDVQLLVYTPGRRGPCAGVTPPGYYYRDIPYVEAEHWEAVGSRLVVVFDYNRLVNIARSCGSRLVLVAWIGDVHVDARPIG